MRINRAAASPLWRGVSTVKDIFFLGISKEVGSGRGTRFLLDKWCSYVPLGKQLPNIFNRAANPEVPGRLKWSGAGWIIPENPEKREDLSQLLPVTLIHIGDIRNRPT